MTILSKPKFRLIGSDLPCTVFHPWTPSCHFNYATFFLKCVKGSGKFFLLLYILIPKLRGLPAEALRQQAICFIKDCLFGGFCGSTSVAAICFFRWMRGKFFVSNLGLIPGTLAGAGIFIEDSSKRSIAVTCFIALVSDLYFKLFQNEGVITVSPTMEFFIFSFCSTFLLFTLRTIQGSHAVLWPFIFKHPQRLDNKKKCAHKGSCANCIKKIGTTYFSYGVVIQCIKLTVFNLKKIFNKPTSIGRMFFNLNNLRLPLFAGLYVSLYTGVCCLLRSVTGQEEEWHTLPAAAIASLCYLIQPNITLALFAFSNLSQIVCKQYQEKLGLPNWPWKEFAFMVSMGLLFHARAAYPQSFPPYMLYIMDSITDGRAPIVYDLAEKHMIERL